MTKDTLYLLKNDFKDGDKSYFCPGCAEVCGYLSFFPEVKEHLEIKYVDFARPRPELVRLLGENQQDCPVLVLSAPTSTGELGPNVRTSNGNAFVEGSYEITEYLAHTHHTPLPH